MANRTEADDDVAQLIAEHVGDVPAAIVALLSDRNFLVKELEIRLSYHGFWL